MKRHLVPVAVMVTLITASVALLSHGAGGGSVPVGAQEPTYHITVDMVADGAPGNVQSSREVTGSFTIEVEVGDAFSMPDSWFQGLYAVEFGLEYPQSLVTPSAPQWDINEDYLAGWSCSTNSTDGGLAVLVCSGWLEGAAHPTGPGVVASLTFNLVHEACGQGELILVDDWCGDGCPPELWGNDWLFEPLVLNSGSLVVPCPTPTPSPTPTPTPSPTPTATASPTATPTPTATPSPTPSPTPTPTPSPTPSPTPIGTPIAAGTATPTATPAPTGTPTIAPQTATPLSTVTPSPTPTPYGGAAPGARGPLPPATGAGGLAAGGGSALGWPWLAALVLALAAACAAALATVKSQGQ